MLSGATGAEVINHRCHIRELTGSVGPHIGAVGFLCSRHEHLHRCFICVDDLLPKHYFAQRIDQRLQLNSGHANPLSQG
ncbi:hypothetical protein D3C75_1011700 [compost metagenome]